MGSIRSSSDANWRRRKPSPPAPETTPQPQRQNQPAQNQHAQSQPAQEITQPSLSPRDRELTTKRRGELAELAFTLKATTLGFAVCKPYGDSERYDFILDSRDPDTMPKLSRVQVKCSTQLLNGLYRINAHRRINGRAVPYKLTEIDFIAAYIIPENSWFILPLRDILGLTSLLFRCKRDRRPGLYDSYREAWPLLRP